MMKAEAPSAKTALSQQGVHVLAIQVAFFKQSLSQFVKARFVSDPVRQPLGVGMQVAQVDVVVQKGFEHVESAILTIMEIRV